MNTIKTTLRKALNNKWTSLLNIFGLVLGFSCTILLMTWLIHESNYDDVVPEKESIFRAYMNGYINDEHIKSAGTFPGIAGEANKLIPEIEKAVRIDKKKKGSLIKTDENRFFRTNGFAADEGFFSIFPFAVISGKISGVLSEKDKIIIDETLAQKCFGEQSAIGRTVTLNNQLFEVAAVLEKVPSNSHLQFQYIIPSLSLGSNWHKNEWGSDAAITYFKLVENANVESINEKLTQIVCERIPEIKKFDVSYNLQPLSEIPFDNTFKWDNAKKTSKRNIYVLSVVAFLILFIACVNFTNLFLSSALKRKKEIGIKISNGANKVLIIREYLLEVLTYVLFSFAVSLLIVHFALPLFNKLSGSIITVDLFSLKFCCISLGVILGTTILAGLFPASFVYHLNVTSVVKGARSESSKASHQKILVTTQFVITSVLLFAMLTIFKQVNYLHTKNIGFDKENILYVFTEGKLQDWKEQNKLKNELLRHPSIKKIAFRSSLPTEWSNGSAIGKSKKEIDLNSEWIQVDHDYFDLLDIDFVEGENIFATAKDSSNFCVVNQKLAEAMGLQPPYMGKVIYSRNFDKEYIIKGVTNNINTKSLVKGVDLCLYTKPMWASRSGVLMFKVIGDKAEGIKQLRAYWENNMTEQPFEYHFLDDTYSALYNSEEKARSIITSFACIALLLTSLGLFAMVHFISEQRTKEIGVRKVNGAKIIEVLAMLNKDFLKWVLLAYLIACPVAYYSMTKWLENFAYKTPLSWWIFALAGLLALGIALLTVSFQSYKAATRNPIESLRYE